MGKKRRQLPIRLNAPLVDSHCHLELETYPDLEDVIKRAFDAGISALITIGSGYGPESIFEAVKLAERYKGKIWATSGIHPHQASQWNDEVRKLIIEAAKSPLMVAVGEIGLDFHYDYSPRPIQRAVFEEQIELAKLLNRPLVIHDRETSGETLEILKRHDAFSGKVLYHCFSGNWDEAEKIIDLGGYLSLPGVLTYKKANAMREVAVKAPLERLMVETDSPFLTPEPWRGYKNEPARVLYTLEELALLRNEEPNTVAMKTTRTVESFFGIDLGL